MAIARVELWNIDVMADARRQL